ncbi:MAG TPA: CapA family protein, partial [Acidimicrobiales bacterium]|nr:CapA family protein [Acidimicrobiales bacterium]
MLSAVAVLAVPMSGAGTGTASGFGGYPPAPLLTAPFRSPQFAISPATPSATRPRPTIPPAVAAPPTTAPPSTTFTIAASGDFLAHRPVVARAAGYGRTSGQAYDFRPMLAAVEPVVSAADLAICHLETPLSPDGRDLSGFPTFNVPGDLATAIAAAGYDTCSLASNHSLDRGPAGVAATLGVLDAAGIGHAGTARTPEEA